MLQSLTQGVWFDESVRLVRLHWATRDGHQSDLPTLFLDDYTVLSEVRDLRSLVEGDHCVAPVNILHTLFGWFDRFLFELASWEVRSQSSGPRSCAPRSAPAPSARHAARRQLTLPAASECPLPAPSSQALPLRLHHHFIILDTVFDVTADGPVTKSGRPVRVAEYSDSFPNAWRRICPGFEFPRGLYRTGLRQVLANAQDVLTEPAKMHAPLLRDYVPHLLTGAAPRGLFVVQYEQWTAEDRRRIRDRARALVGAPSHPTYRIFTSNCEHFTWSVKGGDARWVSPQVGPRSLRAGPVPTHPGFCLACSFFLLLPVVGCGEGQLSIVCPREGIRLIMLGGSDARWVSPTVGPPLHHNHPQSPCGSIGPRHSHTQFNTCPHGAQPDQCEHPPTRNTARSV